MTADKSSSLRRALDEPRRLTLAAIAKEIGVGREALKKYREGSRPMPPEAREKLVALLERHAQELRRIAQKLKA